MHEPVATARRFARSLDEEDYDVTRELLAPACRYEIGGAVHEGPDAILESYRGTADWVKQTLDGIRYESEVLEADAARAVVLFLDHVEHAGRSLTHRCEQHLTFDEQGRIDSITHVDLPGEKEALERFFAEVGLARPVRREGG